MTGPGNGDGHRAIGPSPVPGDGRDGTERTHGCTASHGPLRSRQTDPPIIPISVRPAINGGGGEVDGRPPMLVTFAVLMAIPAVAVDDPPRTIEGVARFPATDRPAAGV